MSSDEYFTAEEDIWEDESDGIVDLEVLADYGFCVWSSEDGTKWYLPFYNVSIDPFEPKFSTGYFFMSTSE